MDDNSADIPQQNPSTPVANQEAPPSPFFHSSSSDEELESGETSSLETGVNHQRNRRSSTTPNGDGGGGGETNSTATNGGRHRKNTADSTGGASKVCRICGDKALGYNFNVISCESCKAFFRRNALKKKEFVCPFNNTCDVTYVSRRFCQKCRLKKCFDIGMNPDWIMSEEALAAKRRRRLESNGGTLEKLRKISPEPRKIASSLLYPRIGGGMEPILITQADGLSMLANCASSPGPNNGGGGGHQQQQQYALLTQQGGSGPKLITIVPVQQIQQSTARTESSTPFAFGSSTTTCSSSNGTPHQATSTTTVSLQPATAGQAIFAQATSPTKFSDDSVNIPKQVLVNLITKCYSTGGGGDGNNSNNSQLASLISGQLKSSSSSKRCCCKCVCGAKSDDDPIGIEKSDKMISTDDLPPIHHDRFAQFQNGFHGGGTMAGMMPSVTSSAQSSMTRTSSSGSALDFVTTTNTTSGLSRGCRVLSQQHLASTHPPPSPLDHQAIANRNHHQQSMYEEMLDAAIISVFHDGGMQSTNFTVPHSMQSDMNSTSLGYETGHHRQLVPVERQRLEELLAANEVMKEPLDSPNEQRIYEGQYVDPKLMDVINMTDIAVRRIIKMNKRIEAFRNLCQEDQIALLKGGCTELMILRGIMTYDPEKDSWLTQVHSTGHEYIKLEVLKGVRGNVYEEHKKYVQSFPTAWRTSEPIMLILGAITLFNPSRPNIVHKEMIKLEQRFYYELLKNHLSTVYDSREAEEANSGLVDRLETLHRVNEYAASIFLDINPKDVEPLLIEIFDLKKGT